MSPELALGWSLVHSVWEIAAIGAALLLFLLAARRANAQIRYAAALVALLACAAAPPATLALLSRPSQQEATLVAASTEQAAPRRESATKSAVAAPSPELPQGPVQRIEAALPVVVNVWLAGLALMSLRLLGGLVGVWRLKRSGHPDEEGLLQAMAEAIGRKLDLKRPFALLLSNRVEVPTVIGAFKSVILLPAALPLRLTPAQIEALLAHEIAHIRRYDYLVNIIQSVIEAVLFYHPVVWWISSAVRREREHCCDDIAIDALGDRSAYTRALIDLEEARSARLALAANGEGLLARIQRIAGAPQRPNLSSSIWSTSAIGLILCGLLTQSGFAKPTAVETIHIRGQVVSADGHPVSGAIVVCTTATGFQNPARHVRQTTDSQGRYDFAVEPFDTRYVVASSAQYGIGWKEDGQTIKLIPPGVARVQAVTRNGRPLPHLKLVTTLAEAEGTATSLNEVSDLYTFETDGRGMATLRNLPANCRARFDVVDSGFAIDESPRYLPTKGVAQIVVQPATPLRGQVTEDGKPVAGAKLWVYSEQKPVLRTATTDAQGQYKIAGLPAGPAMIHGYVTDTVTIAPKHLFVERGQENVVPLVAEQTGTILGRVTGDSGKPLADTYLLIYKGTTSDHINVASASSLKDGSFTANVAPGSYSVMAIGDQSRSTADFTIASGASTSVTLRMPKRSKPMTATKTLQCRLVDPHGRPVLWRTFFFYIVAGRTAMLSSGSPGNDGVAEVDIPASVSLPFRFHCDDNELESAELTWYAGEAPTIHLHRKPKPDPRWGRAGRSGA